MSSPTDRIREIADAVDIAGVHPSLKILADAARSFVEGGPVKVCLTHRVFVHEWETVCRYAPDATAACSIVSRWLSERPAAHLPPGDEE